MARHEMTPADEGIAGARAEAREARELLRRESRLTLIVALEQARSHLTAATECLGEAATAQARLNSSTDAQHYLSRVREVLVSDNGEVGLLRLIESLKAEHSIG